MFNPSKKTIEVLKSAMAHIQSVPYKVGLRWVFYRLLQDGTFLEKSDYNKLKSCAANARKSYFHGWRPDTLEDTGRRIIHSIEPTTEQDIIRDIPDWIQLYPNLFEGMEAVPFLLYEAGGMGGQFKHFAPLFDSAAFRGDASIPHKFNIAMRIDSLSWMYSLPVHVLYFGDYDYKGLQIPESAMADIRRWCSYSPIFTRIGINDGHAERFGIDEKPEKPGTYEWEALSSEDAGELILEGLSLCVDMDVIEEREEEADEKTEVLRDKIESLLDEI